MAVDECCGSVVFAEQAAVDVVKPVSRDQPVPTGRTCETLRVKIKYITHNPCHIPISNVWKTHLFAC